MSTSGCGGGILDPFVPPNSLSGVQHIPEIVDSGSRDVMLANGAGSEGDRPVGLAALGVAEGSSAARAPLHVHDPPVTHGEHLEESPCGLA
jgi:hypothetical protein